jgi:hypothetical protein
MDPVDVAEEVGIYEVKRNSISNRRWSEEELAGESAMG